MLREYGHALRNGYLFWRNLLNGHYDFSTGSSRRGKVRCILNVAKKMLSDYSPLRGIRKVRLEASSICQLKCPACPTGTGEIDKSAVGKGFLTFENFSKFVDGNPRIKSIELSNYGEMFLNPDLGKIMRYAHMKRVTLTAGNGVNLNNASDELLEHTVKYRVRCMTVSIDGASPKTYGVYRRGGDFDKVIENIRRINHYKEKYDTRFPELTWKFVIFGHNEHELPEARRMARVLGMDFNPKLNFSKLFPVKDKELVRKEVGSGASSEDEFRERNDAAYFIPCYDLWFQPAINWDGKLLGCCVNFWGDFGNVFETGLKECMKSERYESAKNLFLGKKVTRKDIPCFSCIHRKK